MHLSEYNGGYLIANIYITSTFKEYRIRMLSRIIINNIKRSVHNNTRVFYHRRNFIASNFLTYDDGAKEHTIRYNYSNLYVTKRLKSSRKQARNNEKYRKEDSDDEETEEEDEEEDAPTGSKISTTNVQSLRLDLIAKIGFGVTRGKIEEAFYGSNIRLNGQRVLKKSVEVEVGDEIDLVLRRNAANPAFLVVNRIVCLSMSPSSDKIRIKLSKDKNLLIDDYEDPWQSE